MFILGSLIVKLVLLLEIFFLASIGIKILFLFIFKISFEGVLCIIGELKEFIVLNFEFSDVVSIVFSSLNDKGLIILFLVFKEYVDKGIFTF